MPRATPARRSTRERLVQAALEEFAARGFDGAKVDRIARRARANKAMLYYHFRSKADLYAAILRDQFGALGEAVAPVRAAGVPPDEQLRRFIDAIARETVARPFFPPIWLREVAEGGRHLDESVLMALRRVLETLGGILADGRRTRTLKPANPLVTQISIVAPLMFFSAAQSARDRFARLVPPQIRKPELDDVIAHVQAATLAVLGAPAAAGGAER